MARGFFVVLEGPEGSGKTTLGKALVARMREDGVDPVAVREPGGTPALRTSAPRPGVAAEPIALHGGRGRLVTGD